MLGAGAGAEISVKMYRLGYINGAESSIKLFPEKSKKRRFGNKRIDDDDGVFPENRLFARERLSKLGKLEFKKLLKSPVNLLEERSRTRSRFKEDKFDGTAPENRLFRRSRTWSFLP